MTELNEKPKTSKEAMTAIIVTGIVAIFCILACTGSGNCVYPERALVE